MIEQKYRTAVTTPEPRTFPGLMELYERNYMQLRRMIPDLDAVPEQACSLLPGALDLHLSILERCKYTTTLSLTYYFEDDEGRFPAPEIQVRIYRDAQLAEVIACGRRSGVRHREFDRFRADASLACKWRFNRFLQKWLAYSLRQGHAFLPPLSEDIWAQMGGNVPDLSASEG
jgi:uncharacterized protein YqiB (DUF1249 family)